MESRFSVDDFGGAVYLTNSNDHRSASQLFEISSFLGMTLR
jgi:hypothetical protein